MANFYVVFRSEDIQSLEATIEQRGFAKVGVDTVHIRDGIPGISGTTLPTVFGYVDALTDDARAALEVSGSSHGQTISFTFQVPYLLIPNLEGGRFDYLVVTDTWIANNLSSEDFRSLPVTGDWLSSSNQATIDQESDEGGNGGDGVSSLAQLFASQENTAEALASAYHLLLGGVPNEAGFTALINNAISANFGAGPGPVFNPENIYINLFNSLVQGNAAARAQFDAIATGTSLQDKVTAIYQALIPVSLQTAEGLAFITRPEGLGFYQQVAAERGVAGADGAAIVAMASLMRIVVEGNYGIGNAVNDLSQAVATGSHAIPATGSTFTDIEVADGTAFDGDGATSMARLDAAPDTFVYMTTEGHSIDSADAAIIGFAELVNDQSFG